LTRSAHVVIIQRGRILLLKVRYFLICIVLNKNVPLSHLDVPKTYNMTLQLEKQILVLLVRVGLLDAVVAYMDVTNKWAWCT
jgi:hypothetical protein